MPSIALKANRFNLLEKRWLSNRVISAVLLGIAFAAFSSPAQTNDAIESPGELKKRSLEELFDMEVTSVSKKPEKLSETAAAVSVVTGEEIRRSGALSIPEALRDIPGVEVARVDSRQYAITARGFNSTTANKLLVLMDGRSVYTPLFSGVFWDVQDTLMEDIDRIEVIRGPGATVWGANAVNGVINVITKSAQETQGFLISGGGGNEEQGFGAIRYGGHFGSNMFFRVYGKYFDRDDSVLPNGNNAKDRFQMGQEGFRLDWKPSTQNTFTLQGDAYRGLVDQPASDNVDWKGGNVLGRWTHQFSENSDLQIQTYYDRTERQIPPIFGEKLDTFDLDLRHRFAFGARQDITWGADYRLTDDDVDNSSLLAFLPPHLTQHLITGFLQDEIKVIENRLHVTLGTKLEHNDYSGFEYEPSGRIAWTPAKSHTIWGAVSRAVRTPSRIDRDFFVPPTPPSGSSLAGGPNFISEKLYAFEVGYKAQPLTQLTASVATFYNIYDDLRSVNGGPVFVLGNGLKGESYGVEVEATGQLLDWWQLSGGYTFFDLQLHTKPGTPGGQEGQERDSPRQQFFLRSRMDFPHHLELDGAVRYVDSLPDQRIPHYLGLDIRLGWRPLPNLELSIFAANLLDPRHPEFGTPATRREIERSIYGKVTCRF